MKFVIGPISITCVSDVLTYMFRIGNMLISFDGELKLKVSIPDDQTLPFVSPSAGVDARGNPTILKGPVVVSVSDPALLSIVQPDPRTPEIANSGVIQPLGPLGTGQVRFDDTNEGNGPISIVVDVEVLAGATVGLGQPTFGPLRTPEVLPTAAP